MSGTRFESPEQAQAFSGLYRDTGACAAFVHDLPHHAVLVTLWAAGSDVPVCKAIISSAGTVRTELALAA
jgi:hypothetical protein